MTSRWFRVPRIGDGSEGNSYRPKYSDRVDHFSGNTLGNSPMFVVRFYADDATLDGIAAEGDTTELTAAAAANLFNNQSPHVPNDFDAQNINERFRVA